MKPYLLIASVLLLITGSIIGGIQIGRKASEPSKIEVTEAQLKEVYQKGKQDTVNTVLKALSGKDSVIIGKDSTYPTDDKEYRYLYIGNKAIPLNMKNAPVFILNNDVGETVVSIDREGAVTVNKEKFTNYFKK